MFVYKSWLFGSQVFCSVILPNSTLKKHSGGEKIKRQIGTLSELLDSVSSSSIVALCFKNVSISVLYCSHFKKHSPFSQYRTYMYTQQTEVSETENYASLPIIKHMFHWKVSEKICSLLCYLHTMNCSE